ncbi:MAG: DUF2029 domain-containing protein, partial [Silvibacterium sp.]|nr:DUF2029 domain-containing protein [Silvibacterium sp.]
MKSPQHKLQALVFGVCALYFLAVGGYKASHYSPDFMPVYTGSRCLLHGCNPYDIPQLQQQYFLAGGLARQLPKWKNEPPVYPPSTFLVVSPLTFLSWPAARTLWGVMNGLLLIAAAVLIVGVCPCSYRWLATVLASLAFLMSASNILALGQPATFAIALLAIGVILFVQGRYLPLAAVLMTLSLA